jgi:hypothetical protein
MPSAKEMRCWLVLGLVLLWATFAWTLYDQLMWGSGNSPQETLRQLQRTTGQLGWVSMVGMGFGALMVTRFAYCILRAYRQDGLGWHLCA